MGSRGASSKSSSKNLKWGGTYKATLSNGNKVEVSVSQLVESVISTGIGKMGGYGAGQREQRIKKIESNFKKSPVQMQELLKHAVKNANLTTLIANEDVSTVAEALERLYG